MRNKLFLFSLFIVFLVSSCKKQKNNVFLTNNQNSGFNGIGYVDDFTLITRTVREDSLKTDSLSYNLLGSINDPTFGVYKAETYFELALPQFGNVISSKRFDSAVLFLQYTSTTANYGDLNSIQNLEVVELNESMTASKQYSNISYNVSPTVIGSYNNKFTPSDSTKYRNNNKIVAIAPSLKINLSNAFGNKLFNASSTDLSSQANFLNYIKGIGIRVIGTPSSNSGAIASINLKGTFSKIRVYYDDSLHSDFVINPDSKRISTYQVSNQGIEILKQKSMQTNFDTGYLQSLTGAKLKIQIPNLFKIINNKTIAINKAEVYIRPLAGTNVSPFKIPSRLLLLQPNASNNLNAGIIDLVEPFYGGSYNSIENYYKFNVTRHIQDLFIDKQLKGVDNNRGFFLIIPTDNPITPSRIYVDTRKGIKDAGIEFKLYYSEL